MKKRVFTLISLILFSQSNWADEKTLIRLGVQATGTLEWELAVLPNTFSDFTIETKSLATPEAGKIALQSGAVDIIISDWLWVSGQRAKGTNLTFYPYSTTSGALIVSEKSSITSIKDLEGKRLGIVGGELDKNWQLLQTLAKQKNVDLSKTEKVFGAPPLLTEQLKQNRVDAILTYWHFAAKLETQGFKQILDGQTILQSLGISDALPTLGYVFKEEWANTHSQILHHFFDETVKAKKQLCNDEKTWEKIVPLTKVNDKPTLNQLRSRYCQGQIQNWGIKEKTAINAVSYLLKTENSPEPVMLQKGTFWE